MKIAVIPARGGSKRIPRKNIKVFADKPMIGHAILTAKASGLFDHIIVSTDDEEIAQVAKQFGAELPFVRPSELADDHTPTVPVIAHAIERCQELGWNVEFACCIYPGVPFLMVEDLQQAFELLKNSAADYSFPMAEFPSAIQRALRSDTAGRVSPFNPENVLVRTQDLEAAYYDAGQFYWGPTTSWKTKSGIHLNGAGLRIPSWRAVDIDTSEDCYRAEILYAVLKKEGE
jgi:pseudaminic acid cytidylyltransferase